MICPCCGKELEDELIYDYCLSYAKDPDKALKYAEAYGATKTEGRFRNYVAIKDIITFNIIKNVCMYCKGSWDVDGNIIEQGENQWISMKLEN